MKIGIGYQNQQDAETSGKDIAEMALKDGGITRSDFVLAFCHQQVDHEKFFQGIRAVVGAHAPIIGGSAIGIITNTELSYDGHPAGIAIVQSDVMQCTIAAAGALDQDEREAGRALARQLTCDGDEKLLLICYDSVKVPATATTPPVMNASPPLIAGIEEMLDRTIPILGAGVLGDYTFSATKQFCGFSVETQHVVGAMLSGHVMPYLRIMHGCVPMDGVYHTITRIEGPVIYELDGCPVVEMIDRLYGNQTWQSQVPVRRLSLGVNLGEKYDDFQEGHYVNRLIAGVLPSQDGIVMFETDLEPGTDVQFMVRDGQKILESARSNSVEVFEQIAADGKNPLFGLYIDCGGRSARVSETRTEEATEVMQIFKQHDIPLLGCYSGVEVAPIDGKSKGLDWTGVLMVIAEELS